MGELLSIVDHLPGGVKLTPRQGKLDTLLCFYNEANEVLHHSGLPGGRSDGSRPLFMPEVWTKSFYELERALGTMKTMARDWPAGSTSRTFLRGYLHLRQWYLHTQPERMRLMRTDKKGRPFHQVKNGVPQFELAVNRRQDMHRVEWVLFGLGWVAGEFLGDVVVPKQLGLAEAA